VACGHHSTIEMGAAKMSMWNQDLDLITTDELEGLCDELEMKLDEGRNELVRREEMSP
jgi:DNA-binding Xre family transcriptional regulator